MIPMFALAGFGVLLGAPFIRRTEFVAFFRMLALTGVLRFSVLIFRIVLTSRFFLFLPLILGELLSVFSFRDFFPFFSSFFSSFPSFFSFFSSFFYSFFFFDFLFTASLSFLSLLSFFDLYFSRRLPILVGVFKPTPAFPLSSFWSCWILSFSFFSYFSLIAVTSLASFSFFI